MNAVLEEPKTAAVEELRTVSAPQPKIEPDLPYVYPGDVIAGVVGIIVFVLLWLLVLAEALSWCFRR